MLIGYMRVSSENDRQVFDLQYDSLIGFLYELRSGSSTRRHGP